MMQLLDLYQDQPVQFNELFSNRTAHFTIARSIPVENRNDAWEINCKEIQIALRLRIRPVRN